MVPPRGDATQHPDPDQEARAMTAIRPETKRRSGRARRWPVVAAVGVGLIALAAAGVWWFLRDDAPEAVSLQDATAALQELAPTSTTSAGAAAVTPATGESTGPPANAAASPLAGRWSVDTSIGTFSFEDSTGSFVGFRVQEELTSIGSTTAVGRTPAVSGTLSIDGTTVTAVQVEADLSALVTNDRRRDDRARSALDTDRYPTAAFRLTEPIELGEAVATGAPVSVLATGELTIRDVTRTVRFPLQAQLSGQTIVVVGSLEITFADYGVQVPTAPVVVSAEDHGPIELQLFFSRA
jgi:polyisoprenoid-binding protein YceI